MASVPHPVQCEVRRVGGERSEVHLLRPRVVIDSLSVMVSTVQHVRGATVRQRSAQGIRTNA